MEQTKRHESSRKKTSKKRKLDVLEKDSAAVDTASQTYENDASSENPSNEISVAVTDKRETPNMELPTLDKDEKLVRKQKNSKKVRKGDTSKTKQLKQKD